VLSRKDREEKVGGDEVKKSTHKGGWIYGSHKEVGIPSR